MDKRYQVFVSSTYTDLADERRAVIQTLVEMDCIPAGMELFPAADEEQFEFIKKVIDDCDYYLLIIANRYGSTDASGISYTEKEYDYAVGKGIKVVALIHGSPEQIPSGKSEDTAKARAKLEVFRNKVKQGRLVKFWTSADQLPGLVSLNVQKAIKMYPAVGWVRADKVDNTMLLTELNEIRKRNKQLEVKLLSLINRPHIDDLADLSESIKLHGENEVNHRAYRWECDVTWNDIFATIAPYLLEGRSDDSVKHLLEQSLVGRIQVPSKYPKLDVQVFQTVKIQLIAHGLVDVSPLRKGFVGSLFWSLTPKGRELLMQLRTVRRTAPAANTESA